MRGMKEKLDLDVARVENTPVEGCRKQADLVHRRCGPIAKSPPTFFASFVRLFAETASDMPCGRHVHCEVDVEEIRWPPRRIFAPIFAPVVGAGSGQPEGRRHQRHVGAVEDQRLGAQQPDAVAPSDAAGIDCAVQIGEIGVRYAARDNAERQRGAGGNRRRQIDGQQPVFVPKCGFLLRDPHICNAHGRIEAEDERLQAPVRVQTQHDVDAELDSRLDQHLTS